MLVRPLHLADLPRLPEIRPTYRSSTILTVQRTGHGITTGWEIAEQALAQPFDRGNRFDFNSAAQEEIRERLERPDDTYQRVAEHNHKLIGLLDMEIQDWNDTVTLWTLMIDLDYRGQGLGRRLWSHALDFARQLEVRAIMIETQNTNPAACKFYARMGCQLVGLNEAFYSTTNDVAINEIALFWAYFMV
ncbi:MAG: GNAT family N-acetyltransferase [Chloroflexota bacterium]